MTSRRAVVAVVVVCLLGTAVFLALARDRETPAKPLSPKAWIDKEMARIKAAGEPVTVADLAGDPIPDSENAALVYAKIFDQLQGYLDSKDADVIGRFLLPEEREKDPELWQKARLAMARYSGALALVEEAAAKPKCRFPIQWQKGVEAEFPHYAKLRNLARLLLANAILQSKDGRTSDAVRSLDLSLRLADSIKNDQTLIALLVRVAIMNMTARSSREVASHASIDQEQAKQLFDTLAKTDLELGHVKAMWGERTTGIWVFDQLRKGRDVLTSGALESPEMLDAEEQFYLRQMVKHIDAAHSPYRAIKSRLTWKQFDAEVPDYALVSRVLIPFGARAHLARDKGRANLALMQLSVAAHAYRDRFGSYPPNLDDLKTRLGWKLPQDPFSGRDVGYRVEGKGFTLYSIGPDLKDDGGIREKDPREREGPGDIIWKHQPR